MSNSTVESWGRYPHYPQTPHQVHWRSELAATYAQLAKAHTSTLAFGNGRSYGDSCLAQSQHLIHTAALNRFIHVDWQTGIIAAEAGVTLADILSVAVPNGWFLPVTPGTKYVTLGGAVANDVHGKNHHVRGTFGCHVRSFGLIRSNQDYLICSKEQNTDLFAASIGGLGLTGIIDYVELQLMPIRSSMIDTTTVRFNNLAEFFALANELDAQHEYSVAWIDCLAKGTSIGRGVFFVGDHAQEGGLIVPNKRKLSVPFTPPISAINQLSLRLFNSAYYRAHHSTRSNNNVSYEPFFYPLDGILQWNRLYGRHGFQQYQCVIPDNIAQECMTELLQTIAKSGSGSFLAVLKKCGDIPSPGLLSFPMSGVSLALDFPQHQRLNQQLFPLLDAIVYAANGRLYPAKDAHMSGEHFRRFYPNWQKLDALRDPALLSRFWHRVTEL